MEASGPARPIGHWAFAGREAAWPEPPPGVPPQVWVIETLAIHRNDCHVHGGLAPRRRQEVALAGWLPGGRDRTGRLGAFDALVWCPPPTRRRWGGDRKVAPGPS
jgi:hypothetical protein